MSTKRSIRINDVYEIVEVLPPLDRKAFVGYKLRVTMQIADDHLPGRFLACEGVALGGQYAGQKVLLLGVRLRRDADQRPVCRCRAYAFPHNRGQGLCYAKSAPPFCSSCGRPTSPILRLSVTGTAGSPVDGSFSSACCRAALRDDAELRDEWEP